MPIPGIEQPELLPVDEELRLRRYDEEDEFALAWYQDEETLMLVDGKFQPYDRERLKKMYHYLNDRGEVYFIELQGRKRLAADWGRHLLAGGHAHRGGRKGPARQKDWPPAW